MGIEPGTLVDAQGRPTAPIPGTSNPFIASVILFAGNFAPTGWSFCHGQLLAISSNSALFSLLGTIYGGDGEFTFALPDLRARVPVGVGNAPGLSSIGEGQRGGVETVTLASSQMPLHTHVRGASGDPGTTEDPAGAVPAVPASSIPQYAHTATAALDPTGATGGSEPHENRPPFLGMHYIIARAGVYPSES